MDQDLEYLSFWFCCHFLSIPCQELFILLFSLSLASLDFFSSLNWIIACTQKHTIYLFLKMRVMDVCVSFSYWLFQLVQPLHYFSIPLCQLSLKELFILLHPSHHLQFSVQPILWVFVYSLNSTLLKYYEFYFPKFSYAFPYPILLIYRST